MVIRPSWHTIIIIGKHIIIGKLIIGKLIIIIGNPIIIGKLIIGMLIIIIIGKLSESQNALQLKEKHTMHDYLSTVFPVS